MKLCILSVAGFGSVHSKDSSDFTTSLLKKKTQNFTLTGWQLSPWPYHPKPRTHLVLSGLKILLSSSSSSRISAYTGNSLLALISTPWTKLLHSLEHLCRLRSLLCTGPHLNSFCFSELITTTKWLSAVQHRVAYSSLSKADLLPVFLCMLAVLLFDLIPVFEHLLSAECQSEACHVYISEAETSQQ